MNQRPASQPKKTSATRDDNLYRTEDQEEVLLLLTHHHTVVKREREGRLVSFFFDRVTVQPLMDLWLSGAPVPVSDIRDVYVAMRKFNQMVHGEC